jgi:lipopolysaccharide/colanic/teichoic acid biosynthesis glycosyltransferase
MKLIRWITWLCKSTKCSRANSFSIIQSKESFHASVIRERQRVDRNQHLFSLLLFTVGKQNSNGVIAQQLAHLIAERIRSTDEAGWFDNKHIGVILPYTCADGAYKLAEEICKEFDSEAMVPEYTVHIYPSNRPSDSNKHRDKNGIVDLPDRRTAITSQSFSLPVKYSQDANSIPAKSPFTGDVIGTCRAVPKSIEPFFFQSLPVWKRIADVIGSLLGLIVLSPFLVLIALIIKVDYGGPVIFKQKRVGYSGRIFTMWKFRTMKTCAESSLHQQYMSSLIHDADDESSVKAMTKLDDDLPVTGFGRILRATSFDEIPQLINVLCGDMTLIGPRPPIIYEVENYLPWHCERFSAVPGITGLWQVSGKNKLTFLEMIRLDIRYSRNLSMLSDIIIFLKTPLVIAHDFVNFLNLHRFQYKLKGYKNA